MPPAIVTQNAVERSRSESSLRWTSAAPSARSEKTSTRLAKTSASMARPYSPGVSSRATTIAPANRISCSATCEPPVHATPRLTRECISAVAAIEPTVSASHRGRASPLGSDAAWARGDDA